MMNKDTLGDRYLTNQTSTYVNGVEQKCYDQVKEWINSIESYFVNKTEYVGYPELPPNFTAVENLFYAATEEERRIIFSMVYLKLIQAYRHWSVDLDLLYTDDGIKKHAKTIAEWEPFWKNGVRNWGSFFENDVKYQLADSNKIPSNTANDPLPQSVQPKYDRWTLMKDERPPEPKKQMQAYWIVDVHNNTHVMFYLRADIRSLNGGLYWYGPIAEKDIVAWVPLLEADQIV